MKRQYCWLVFFALMPLCGRAVAATCTSIASGNWNNTSVWSCGTVPGAGDAVIIASPYTVSLNNSDRSAASLTINAGGTLNDNGRNLTVSGNVVINGTYDGSGNDGDLIMTGDGTTLSGTGTIIDIGHIYIDADVTIPAGSNLNLTLGSEIRVGDSAAATLTIDGTVTGTSQDNGNRILRLDNNHTSSVILNGTINAPNSYVEIQAGGTFTNNGTATLQYLDGNDDATATWTQGANSSLTLSQPTQSWSGTFNASAVGNTVTWNAPATPLTPSANTYYNLAGSGVTCPHGFTVLGSDPCAPPAGSTTVTASPTACVNVTSIGTKPWGTLTGPLTSNNAYASATVGDGETTNYLQCTGYGFSIPSNATIVGIIVGVERYASNTNLRDAAMRIVKGGVIGTADRSNTANYPTSDPNANDNHGSYIDLWGSTWTAADINASNFGAAFASRKSNTSGGSRTIWVDHMPITVTYTSGLGNLDHLEIQSSGSGLTCAANTLTIRACADAACTTPYTTGVSGTLSATGTPPVNWDGTTGGASGAGFVIASGSSSVTKNMQVAAAGSVVLGVASATPTPSSATTCNFGSPACTFTANLAGFIFSDTTTGGSYTIPAQVSGVAAPGLYLRAVQASTTNPAVCTPAIINQTATVDMGYACDDPATCSAGSLATINTIAVAPLGTPVSLTFDANGAAPVSARYDDVGQIRLTASTTVTPFGGATPVTLNGNSNAYVVRPHHFDLTAIKCTTADAANCGAGALAMPTPGDNPAAADASGPSFIAAGTPFSVTVTARNALNGATPNFGNEVAPESVVLTPTLVAPAGGSNPALGGSFGAFNSGVATGTNFTWGEAGIVTLTPGIADGNYLGAGNTTGTASGNVGRFYPHHFALSGASLTNRVVLSCTPASTFTYAGEKFRATFTLTAQNAADVTTANYSGAFAKFGGAVPANYGFGAIDKADAIPPLSATPNLNLDIAGASSSGSWAAGVGTLSADLGLTRAAAPDDPYESFNLGVDPVDPDGVKLGSYDLDVDNNTLNDHGLVGMSKIRFGRLKLSNAHGSEVLDLPIGIQTQYWNGTAFVGNTDDNCTTLAPANITLGNYQGGITAANMGAGHVSFTGPFAAGIGNLKLTKPSSAPTGKGSVDVTVDLVTEGKSYLQGAWTGTSYNENPSARATFGVFKNPNEFIYLRENF